MAGLQRLNLKLYIAGPFRVDATGEREGRIVSPLKPATEDLSEDHSHMSVNDMWVKFKTGFVEAVERFIPSKMTKL